MKNRKKMKQMWKNNRVDGITNKWTIILDEILSSRQIVLQEN